MSDSGSGDARRRWIILGVVYLCILSFAIVLQSVPPILNILIDEMRLSHAQGGLLMSLFALPGVAVSIPAGMLADRYGVKVIGIVSFVLVIAGVVVFATAQSFAMLSAGRIVSGMGAMTLMVVAPQLLAHSFRGRELGTAMGVFNTGMPLGTILSLNLLSMLAESMGWRFSIWLTAYLCLGALVLFGVYLMFLAPAHRKGEHGPASSAGLFQSIRQAGTAVWLVGVAWMLFNAAVISLFTFTPDFLEGSGFSAASAGFLTSLVMWPALVLSPAVGYIIDRVGRKLVIIGCAGVTLAAIVVLIPQATGWMLGLMLLIGIVQAFVPAPVFALIPDVVSPALLGLGYGIVSTCLNLGIVVGPAVAGLTKDASGSYQASYALMAGFALLIALAASVLGLRQRARSRVL